MHPSTHPLQTRQTVYSINAGREIPPYFQSYKQEMVTVLVDRRSRSSTILDCRDVDHRISRGIIMRVFNRRGLGLWDKVQEEGREGIYLPQCYPPRPCRRVITAPGLRMIWCGIFLLRVISHIAHTLCHE